MIKNQGGQSTGAQVVNATTGGAFSGAVTVYVTGDRGTQAIGSVGGGAATLEGNGVYTYAPSQAETNYDFVQYTFVGAGAVPATVDTYTITAAIVAALGGPAGVRALTGLSLCRRAAIEIGHLDPQETLSPGDADFILGTVNALFDDWNAEREAVYSDVFATYSTVAALSPHTIGPTGTFVTAQRPVTIDGAAVLLSGTVRSPIRVDHEAAWWFRQATPALASGMPTDLYYDATWPNGSIYFVGVPDGVLTIALRTRMVLASIALATTFTMPPGYENAVMLTVAETIAAPLGIGVPPKTEAAATKARARIFANNRVPTPKLRTRDSGMGSGRDGATYDYRTGSWR